MMSGYSETGECVWIDGLTELGCDTSARVVGRAGSSYLGGVWPPQARLACITHHS